MKRKYILITALVAVASAQAQVDLGNGYSLTGKCAERYACAHR